VENGRLVVRFFNPFPLSIPTLPFLFVWTSKVARTFELRRWIIAIVFASALTWSVGSSLWCYPHSMSYFDELVGRPKNGHYYLLDSNISWGQDLFYLKQWLDEHPDAKPLKFASFGYIDPRLVGIEFMLPPVGPAMPHPNTCANDENLGPLPGWYAIDVNHLHGTLLKMADGKGNRESPVNEYNNYCYFLHFKPVAMAGYSIYIYHLELDEVNRVRRELGLKELPSL
jgi:hypothetical protein